MRQKYLFKEGLVKGIIISRPNRFIMLVRVKGKIEKCHCPVTDRIGSIVFKNIPCLLSKSSSSTRKTSYTVEAIKVDGRLVGINQNQVNKYIEFFFRENMLPKLASGTVLREQKLGRSRIDFLVGNTFVEAKMPLISFPNEAPQERFTSFDRLIKHFGDLARVAGSRRTVVLLAYVYNAPAFKPPKTDKHNAKIKAAARKAARSGVDNWQVNMRIDSEGVELLSYFKLEMFRLGR